MPKKKGDDRKYCFRTRDLARAKGISRYLTLREIRKGTFNPFNIESVVEWLNKPYKRPYVRKEKKEWKVRG